MVWLDQRGIGLSRPDPVHQGRSHVLPVDRPAAGPGRARRRGRRRRDLRQGLRRGNRRRRGGPPVLRDQAGGRGPRGRPRLPRRRQDGPLRPQLRHAVRADLRRRASRTTSPRCSSTARSISPSTARPTTSRRPAPPRTRWSPCLDACTADETCTRDMKGGDALAAYDALATTLRPARSRSTSRSPTARSSRGRSPTRRPRDRGLQRALLLVRPAPPPALDRGRVARRLRAARALGLRRARRRSGRPSSRRPTRAGRTRSTTPSSARTTRSSRTRATRTPGSTRGSTAPRRTASTTSAHGDRATTATCRACTGRRATTDPTGPRRSWTRHTRSSS